MIAPAFESQAQFCNKIRTQDPHIFLVVFRSTNRNVVVYRLNIRNGSVCTRNPVDIFWLDIEPSYQAKRRAKGITHDRCEMSALERKCAYGCSVSRVSKQHVRVKLRLAQIEMDVRLLPSGKAVGTAVCKGRRVALGYAHVRVRKVRNPLHLIQIVQNLHIFVYKRSATGLVKMEKLQVI